MKQVRKQEIIDLITKEGYVSTDALAEHFGVSAQTIRRDLDELDEEGIVTKMYGGATLVEKDSGGSPFGAMPATENQDEKAKIAQAAINLISDNSVVAVDGGSTLREFAHLLNEKQNLVVITRDVLIASTLVGHPTNQVYLAGGFVDGLYETSGHFDDRFLNTISHVDSFIFGTSGVTIQEGFTNIILVSMDFRARVMPLARNKIALVDHTKFGKVCFYRTCGITDVSHIITDKATDHKILDEIRSLGVNVTIAE